MLVCMLQIFHAGLSDGTRGIHPIGEFEGLESRLVILLRCRCSWKRRRLLQLPSRSELAGNQEGWIRNMRGTGSRFQWALRIA